MPEEINENKQEEINEVDIEEIEEDQPEEIIEEEQEEIQESKPKSNKKPKKTSSNKKTTTNKKTNSNKKTTKRRKKTTGLLKKVITVVILVAILGVISYFAFKTLAPEKAVATVNGDMITQTELDQKYAQLPEQYQLFITKEDFLDQLINVKLLLGEAKTQNIEISDEEIDAEVDNIKSQTESEELFEDLLKQRSITLEDLKEQIKEQITINKLLDQVVFSKIEISESRIKEYYQENLDSFNAKEGEIRISHILVATEEAALGIIDNLKSGSDFNEIAKSMSLDTTSAVNGGELGFVTKGQMVKEFEDAAFTLKVGEISEPVKTQFGYHIINRGTDNIPYEIAKVNIGELLSNEVSNNAIQIYLDQLRANAEITKSSVEIEDPTEETEEGVIIEDSSEEVVELEKGIETFKETGDDVCLENGKPIIRLFSTTTNSASKWIGATFDKLADENQEKVVAYHWQLDTGDNTITEAEENGISKKEIEIFQKYNKKNTVPTFVFGCKYIRVGNAYKSLEEEQAEFARVIDELTTD